MKSQRAEWGAQRVGWAVMGLIVVAAVLGLLGGPGVLGGTHWGEEGKRFWVDGRRMERHHRPTQLDLHVANGVSKDGRVEVSLEGSYLQKMKIEKIAPEPVEMRREGERVVMVFLMGAEGGSVTMHAEPEEFGGVELRLRAGAEEVAVKQWILP